MENQRERSEWKKYQNARDENFDLRLFFAKAFSHYFDISYLYPQTKQTKIFLHVCHQHLNEYAYMKIDNAVLHITCHEYLIHSMETNLLSCERVVQWLVKCCIFIPDAYDVIVEHSYFAFHIGFSRQDLPFLSMRIASFIFSFVMAPSPCYVYFFNYSQI